MRRRRNPAVVTTTLLGVGAAMAGALAALYGASRFLSPSGASPLPGGPTTPDGTPATPSGPAWVTRYPGSRSLDDLVDPFKSNLKRFVAAVQAAGATVHVNETYRPAEQAYLMHYAWNVARGNPRQDPTTVPPMAGVPIDWVAGGVAGAEAMVKGFGIVYQPALDSEHIRRTAVDMDVTWSAPIVVKTASGGSVVVPGPGTGATSQPLWNVAQTYGVVKLASDAPHWSVDGH